MTLRELGFKAIEQVAICGGGRFAWCSTTKSRWKRFCDFCDELEVFELSEIDALVMQKYAQACGGLAIATVQNYLSSANTVLKIVSLDWEAISPKLISGRSRSSVRKKPISFSREDIQLAVDELENSQKIDLAAVVWLAANFGLRRRECSLLDLAVAIKQAKKRGFIDVSNGTKGGRGRYVQREIPCDEKQVMHLEKINWQINGRRSLIPEGSNFQFFNNQISNIVIPVLKKHGIGKLHDLRVFYACNRYLELTGFEAPCNRAHFDRNPKKAIDERARLMIATELGHSRMQITSSYVGRKFRGGLGD